MKKGKNILLSIICCLSFLVSLMSPMLQVVAEGDGTTYINKESVTEYKIKTISNVAGYIDIILYEYQEHYYMDMNTIEKLTGLKTSVSTSGGIFSAAVTDGMRTVWVDLTDRTITDTINDKAIKDSNGNEIVNDINAMLFNNDFLVEAVPFLRYLSADVTYVKGYFICLMNQNSIWSVLPEVVKDLDAYTFDFISNIPDYKKRLTIDIISDIISGWNFFKSPNDSLNDYYKDALSDVLKVNPYKYNTVTNKAKENENAKIFDTKYMLDLADQIKDVGSDSYKKIEDLVLAQKIDSLHFKWNGVYKAGFTDNAQKISKELNEKTVKFYNDTVDDGKIDKVGLLIFIAKIADSFYEIYNYDNDAALCLAKEVENIKYAYSDTSSFYWLSEASKISEDVLNNWKNARDSIIDNTVDLMRGVETDLIISAASPEILLPAKAATLITNILCHNIQDAWHHEAVVMYQEEMNSHCLNVCKKLYQKAMDECFTNEDTITRLVDALNFYFRFSIAYNEGVKEWGERYYPQENWDSATQKLNEVLALRYYNLLNSSVSIIRYSELNDDVFSKSILENNSNDDIIDTTKPEEKLVVPEIVQTVFDNTELWHKDTVDNSSYYDEREEYFWFQDIDMDGAVEFITGPAISGAHSCHRFCIWKVENNQLQKVPYIYNSGYQENALMLWHNYSELIDFEHPLPIDSFMLKLFKNTENGHFEYIYTMQDGVATGNVASIYEFDCNTKETKEIFSIGTGPNFTEYLVNADVVLPEDFKTEYNRYISKLQLYDTSVIKLNYYDYSAMSNEHKKDMLLKSYNAWQYFESDESINIGMNSVVSEIKDSSSGLNEEYPLFIGIVNTEKDPLNVRKSPSINAEIIGKIEKGTAVDVYSEADGWCEIRYNGQVGYVSKEFINCEIGGYAKPVIYLYPNEKTDVSVKVKFKNGRFTCTYPDYNDGWNVIAYPDGRIINKNDNNEYSYLYWEGEGQINYDFSSGFVVKREDTAKFLKEKLSYMGLTPKEYNEFIVYWLPIMQENEYNLVSFQMENYDDSAKLNITPEPDSILRVFMAFKETDNKTIVPQQKLEKFERKGFTVIEWGGAEVK